MMLCLECGDKIIGRSDKKFCNESCRNSYNNKNNKDSNNLMRTVHNKLRKNYRILLTQNFVDGKCKLTKVHLSNLGFNFDYISQTKTYKNGSEYRFVYDIGYKFLDNDWILIVKKES